MSVPSKNLIVDASVARAAGGVDSVHPVGTSCRQILLEILSICHKTVMSSDIQVEWNRHQSHFAKRWRASMVARKKLVMVDVAADMELRHAIASQLPETLEKRAALKDCHLIEAAKATGNRVISLDSTSRSIFRKVAPEVPAVAKIAWIDPTDPGDNAVSWLRQGAPTKGRTF